MTYRQLLRENTDFRRLWTAQVVSEVGDWLNNIAVLTLVLGIASAQRQGLAMAFYAISRHVPLFLFNPIAGVIVDRANRRRVMIVADASRALLALGFIFAEKYSSLSVVYATGAALFAVSTFFNVAKRAAIPNLVRGTDELLSANALSSSTTAATIAIGSALGGVIATLIGRNLVFVLNALTFLVSAIMVQRIRAKTEQHIVAQPALPSGSNILARAASGALQKREPVIVRADVALRRAANEFHEGLKYVRGVGVLTAIFIVAAGWGFGNGVARALYAIFGAQLGQAAFAGIVAHPTDSGNAVLYFAMGLGGVLGAPLARRLNAGAGHKLGSRMGCSMIFDGCCLALFSLMPTLWSAAAVLVARELNYTLWKTAQQTIMMSETDDRYAGRVFASYETLMTLMMVGSMLISGVAADVFGTAPVVATGGAVIMLSGILWFALQRLSKSERKSSARAGELLP